MSFIKGLSKTAGDVIDMQKWKADHPLHKVKRGLRAAQKIKVPPSVKSYARVGGVAGGLGLMYGGIVGMTAGQAAEKKRRHMELLEHAARDRQLKKKKK